MSKVYEVVRNLLSDIDKRNAKIEEKIEILQVEAAEVKSSIDRSMQDLISYDLADDEKGQSSSSKQIAQLRSKYDDLQARISSYQEAGNDQAIIQAWIPKVLEVARKARDERIKTLKNKNAQRDKLKQDIESMTKQLEAMDNEISALGNRVEVQELRPMLKYIETRKFKYGAEERYLNALIDGQDHEVLEWYLESAQENGPQRTVFKQSSEGPYAEVHGQHGSSVR